MEQWTVCYIENDKIDEFRWDDNIFCKCYKEEKAQFLCVLLNKFTEKYHFYVMYDKKGGW